MTSNVIYLGDLRTNATHLQSNNQLITDAPLDNQGKGEAFSPTDLTATSLASCMLTIMGIVAKRHNLAIEQTKAQVTKIMADSPRRIARIEISIEMPQGSFNEQDKDLLEKAARTCPVAKSLHPDIEQVITFIWQ